MATAPADEPKVFGSAPKIGETQEPLDSPSSDGISTFGGAPAVGPPLHKGEKQVGPHSNQVYPEVYGGGAQITKNRHDLPPASGSGDRSGGGASGSEVIP